MEEGRRLDGDRKGTNAETELKGETETETKEKQDGQGIGIRCGREEHGMGDDGSDREGIRGRGVDMDRKRDTG